MTSMGPIEKPRQEEEVVDMDELTRQQDPDDEVGDIENDDDDDEVEDPDDVDNLD